MPCPIFFVYFLLALWNSPNSEMGASPVSSICCGFMGLLFAYSASVQLNDADWYLWLPLYSLASLVNIVHTVQMTKTNRHIVLVAFWGGLALFVKVVLGACFWKTEAIKWKEFFSLDMENRVVREKLGSGLVSISMLLHINPSLLSRSYAR